MYFCRVKRRKALRMFSEITTGDFRSLSVSSPEDFLAAATLTYDTVYDRLFT